ncbi:hypothetical protein GCM10022197_04850 [Microlunatus spumicola]|uniref:Uncharacterized protein n=1 Tax=Microlunatus spumicola TaxID=81499 RepID=A0ABP6WRB3_9ACTN
MEWGIYLVGAVLSAGLGFAGGQLALLNDRRKRSAVPDEIVTAAAFRLEHLDGQTWSLLNVGDGTGSLVRLMPFVDGLEQWPPQKVAGQVETATSELLPTLAPGETMSVWFSRYDAGLQVIVSWTSEDNVSMGPVRLSVPQPR